MYCLTLPRWIVFGKPVPAPCLTGLTVVAMLCTLMVTDAFGADRTRWVYTEGEFQRGAAGKWHEYQNGTLKYSFVETYRDQDEVILDDRSRSITVSLRPRAAVVTRGQTRLLTITGGWLEQDSGARFEGRYAGAKQWVPLKGEGVYFFAVSFSGNFNVPNARSTFTFAAQHAAEHGTLLSDRIDYRTSDSRHILVGWYNPVSRLGGWLAGTGNGFGNVFYLTESMNEPSTSLRWIKRDYQSRGFNFRLGIASDNDTGKIAVFATKPK